MKLARLHVHGFGKIEDAVFDFGPGLNLFVGENESGKSTLQQALLAALYGFREYRDGKVGRADGATEERFEPWGGGRYATSVEWELDGGDKLRMERRFSGNRSGLQLHDLTRGEEINVVSDRYGSLPPVAQARYLGAVRGVFTSSACVDQGKLSTLGDCRTLSEALVKALDSNEADVSAKDALRRLEEAKEKGVGGPRAHLKPLRHARDEMERAQRELSEWDRARNAADADMRAYAALAAQIAPTQAELQRLKLARARRELADLDGQLLRLRQIEQRLAAMRAVCGELDTYRGFAGPDPGEAAAALDRLQRLDERLAALRERQAAESPHRQELQQCLAAEREAVQRLSHLEAFPSERQGEVRALYADWVAAHERLAAAREHLPQGVPAAPGERRGFSLPVFLLGALLAVVLLTAGFALDALVPAAIAAAVALFVAAVIAARAAHARPANVQLAVRTDLAALEAEEREARQRLADVMRRCGINEGEPEVAVRRFDALVADHYRYLEARRNLQQVERDLAVIAGHDSELAQAGDEQRQARQRFDALMAQADVVADDAEDAYRQYRARHDGHAQLLKAEADLVAAERERDAVLAGKSCEQLRNDRAECEKRLFELAGSSEAAAIEVPAEPAAAIEASVIAATAKLHDMDKRLVELRKDIERRLPEGRSRGEIEERLAYWQREVTKLERFGRALDLAIEHLSEATKRARQDFVPRLNTSVASTVSAITAGRYDDIFVDFQQDGSPRITLSGPWAPQRVDVSRLSLGTVEQCYIALRLAIAGLLSEGGEKLPLILDDPFVNYDRRRLERMLAFLIELSGQHQVLLFSKDETLPAWFAAHVAEPDRLRVFRLGNGTQTNADELLARPSW